MRDLKQDSNVFWDPKSKIVRYYFKGNYTGDDAKRDLAVLKTILEGRPLASVLFSSEYNAKIKFGAILEGIKFLRGGVIKRAAFVNPNIFIQYASFLAFLFSGQFFRFTFKSNENDAISWLFSNKSKALDYVLAFTIFLVLFGASLFISFELFNSSRNADLNTRTSVFESRVQSIDSLVQEDLLRYSDLLFSARGLFNASEFVDRGEWRDFIMSQEMSSRYPAVRALEYVRRVDSSELDDFVGLRVDELGEFSVLPKGIRGEYYVVDYIEPLEGNENVFGFDIYSHEPRRDAINIARDTGNVTLTRPVDFVREIRDNKAVLMMLAVYDDSSVNTLQERRNSIDGLVVAVINADELFSNIFESLNFETDNFSISVFDVSDNTRYSLVPYLNLNNGSNLSDVLLGNSYIVNDRVNIGSRIWEIQYEFVYDYDASIFNQTVPLLVLIFGFILSLLLSLLVLGIVRSRIKSESIAASLVHNVERFRMATDSAYDQVVITDPEGTIIYANPATSKITGYQQNEIIGTKAGVLWGGLMSKSFYTNMWKTIKYDKKDFVGDIVNRKKDGARYNAEVRISPILDARGGIEYFVAIERDVTKEKRFQSSIQKDNKELQRINKLMTDRELKMVELKKQIEELNKRLNNNG